MGPPIPLVLAAPQRVGAVAAELLRNRLLARPLARLLLPARAPALYAALSERGLPASAATVLQTDELAGVAPGDPRSRASELRAAVRGLGFGRVVTLDGAAANLEAEAARHGSAVEAAPLDLAVLVLGRDGHVALDEPPARCRG